MRNKFQIFLCLCTFTGEEKNPLINNCLFYAIFFQFEVKSHCWTVGGIFTFGRSRMFGPEKLRPLAVGRSRSRRLKIKEISVGP